MNAGKDVSSHADEDDAFHPEWVSDAFLDAAIAASEATPDEDTKTFAALVAEKLRRAMQ